MTNKPEDDKRHVLENVAEKYAVEVPLVLSLYGDIDEGMAADSVEEMYTLHQIYSNILEQKEQVVSLKEKSIDDLSDEQLAAIQYMEGVKESDTHILLSTFGGSVHEMFALYDAIESLKEVSDVSTVAFGKVMSAGVLILAAGTKGKRKIGKHCRIMMHPFYFSTGGGVTTVDIENKETKKLQESYIKELAKHTKLTQKELRKIVKKSTNTYFTSQEALEKGLVDVII